LPEEHARLEMLKQNLGNTYHVLTEADLKILAAKTEGYLNSTKIINLISNFSTTKKTLFLTIDIQELT